jgi:hypothetical protein
MLLLCVGRYGWWGGSLFLAPLWGLGLVLLFLMDLLSGSLYRRTCTLEEPKDRAVLVSGSDKAAFPSWMISRYTTSLDCDCSGFEVSTPLVGGRLRGRGVPTHTRQSRFHFTSGACLPSRHLQRHT